MLLPRFRIRARRRLCRLAVALVLSIELAVPARTAPAQPAPPTPLEFVALTPGNALVRFDASTPGTVRRIAITGVRGELRGVDVRPAKGRLYGITATYDLYAIDPGTGKAMRVSTLTAPFDGGDFAGMDFNPQSDRLRLVGITGVNLRVHTDLGAAAVDGPLTYVPKDVNRGRRPKIVAAAYTRSLPSTSTTRLFNLDAGLDVLTLQDPPNNGGLRTIGPLGVDFGPESGFDIVSGPGAAEAGWAGTASTLYRIDLATGTATSAGTIGDGTIRILGLSALLPVPVSRGGR